MITFNKRKSKNRNTRKNIPCDHEDPPKFEYKANTNAESSDGEFDEETFRKNKQINQAKLKKQQSKHRREYKTLSTPQGPTYSASDLASLKASTQQRSPMEIEKPEIYEVPTTAPSQTKIPSALEIAKAKTSRRHANEPEFISLTKPVSHSFDVDDHTNNDDEILLVEADEAKPSKFQDIEPMNLQGNVLDMSDSASEPEIQITEPSLEEILANIVSKEQDLEKRIDFVESEIYRKERMQDEFDDQEVGKSEHIEYAFTQKLLHFAEDLLDMLEVKKTQVDNLKDQYFEHISLGGIKRVEKRRKRIREEISGEFSSELRNHKLQETFNRQIGKKRKIPEGYSSHDSSDDEELLFDNIFEDADENFSSVQKILEWFQNWKDKKSETYVQCYVADCIGKILPVYTDYHLIQSVFNPLKPEFEQKLTSAEWFKIICKFSSNGERIVEQNVLNVVMQRSILPFITENLEKKKIKIYKFPNYDFF